MAEHQSLSATSLEGPGNDGNQDQGGFWKQDTKEKEIMLKLQMGDVRQTDESLHLAARRTSGSHGR